MDEKSLEMLGFPQIRQMVAGFTSFSASRELALNLQPFTDYKRVSLLLQQSAEARRLLALESGFSIGGVIDLREMVKMAALGKVLEPKDLLGAQQVLAAMSQLRGRLKRLSTEFPLLWDIAKDIVELNDLEKKIADCIAPTGEVLDNASPKLAEVRRELKGVREQLFERLEAIIRSPRGRRIIQEPIITEREGRYVILVRVENRHDIRGIVHDVSNTGATVFIEPWVTVELGNTLRELVTEERREIDKILSSLSAELGEHQTEISRSIELVAELDLVLAKARYARRARASEPGIIAFDGDKGQTGILRLVEARHPLLGEKAVPLTVELGRDFSIMVITGPNTGGKTVTIKTIGLLSLMTQAGIPIPASPESSLPVFDSIFADIGDEQSIEQTLSTFSWHMGNIIRIINNATRRSLILLDELGTSTDPTEGSSLARSILLHFLSLGIMTVATTHFSDLKAFAHTTPGLQNASLDFDPVTLTPTYHLMVGIPGGSNALATAARLGLPSEIINHAREMLPKGAQELEALLASLMAERREIETLRLELKKEKEVLAQRRTELESELQRLKTEQSRAIEEARDGIVREAAELHKEIRQAVAELRKEKKSQQKIEQAQRALATVREQLSSETWQTETEAGGTQDIIKPGDTVRLKDAHLEATVLRVVAETGELEVQAGSSRLRLGVDSVDKVIPGGKITPARPSVRPPARRAVPLQLDLRGKRADEVEMALDSYLNDATLAGLSQVRVIHGIGTGTVRNIVRDFLASHPLVKSFRSGQRNEGGDGATVVSL